MPAVHLLEEPYEAIKELERVCKIGGKIIIPTYINASNRTNKKAGYKDVDYSIIDGRMSCAVAIITKQ